MLHERTKFPHKERIKGMHVEKSTHFAAKLKTMLDESFL